MKPTDKQIIDSLLSGKTTLQTCKDLGTHSERVWRVAKENALKCHVIPLGSISIWYKDESVTRNKTKNKQVEDYNGWF